ncbi:hypothetical protein V1J52_21150 [Streptomyces sp. TRM 70351]|uniref:hypothetical protein n=1 Tax=Streptomyces sp. TRM 70351 TaxID=3116552 RepID=UPI002E7AE7DB|nr:hypothetical protein [Streptomyces sp. TRM 70351]MEE1930666.1 hypothetical protein [Streptomyces sp. TRM 70351]
MTKPPRLPPTAAHRLTGPPTHAWPFAAPGPAHPWIPHDRTVAIACGRYFDAVRVRADIAAPALRRLGSRTGPILANDITRIWWFLLTPGKIKHGLWSPGVRVLRPGTRIGIPPLHITTGKDVRWVIAPGHGDTTPDQLYESLPTAAVPSLSADRPGTRQPSRTQQRGGQPRPLTPAQLRVGKRLLAGDTVQETADELGVSVPTIREHLLGISHRAGGTTSAGRATALLTGRHLPPPSTDEIAAPAFTALDLAVLHVLAEVSTEATLPAEMRLKPALTAYAASLRHRTGARSNAHLVGLAYAWGLLAPTAERGSQAP